MAHGGKRLRKCSVAVLVVIAAAGCASGSGHSSGSGRTADGAAPPASASASASGWANPLLGQGADPFVTVVDGRYYYVQAGTDGRSVTLRSATSLATLGYAEESRIFEGGGQGSPCCEWWAPELHRIDDSWYVYVAADDGDNNAHRTYVLRSDDVDGPYRFAGKLELPGDRWAIDATVFTAPDETSYVVWSGWPGATNGEQDIYLARLSSPTTTTGDRVLLSRPTYPWERSAGDVGVLVNEGPSVLLHGGKVFVTYSGSGCWTPDYALGLLTADASGDLLDASGWTKSAEPVFERDDTAGIYGTGHNSFFASPDGRETWLIYHAVTNSAGSCGSDRQVYTQPISWAQDGAPLLGKPQPALARLPSGDPGR